MLWKLLGGAAFVGLAGFAIWLYGGARYDAGVANEQARWLKQSAEDAEKLADKRVADVERGSAAVAANAERIAALVPLLLNSNRSVDDYAKTSAGAVVCRDAERVLAIDALDALLSTSAEAASLGGRPVHPDAATARP